MTKSNRTKAWTAGLAVLLAVAGLGLRFAPYVYAEASARFDHHAIVDPAPAKIAKGRMVDDYFSVEDLGHGTFSIGEPRYYQQNYAYLIVGENRALLFDSGTGTRDMAPVVRSLTRLPLTVMVSHLHFDHLGGIKSFAHVAMIDLPETRADVRGGIFRPGRYEYSGFVDGLAAPEVKIAEWYKPGDSIDLGGRKLTVLSTPGHTPSSAALYDAAAGRLFIGDYIYPTTLYAFLPGASLSAYHQTAQNLLASLPSSTILWTAHCCRAGEGLAAPWLTMKDLQDLDHALMAVKDGKAQATGFYPRRYPVNNQMTLATGFSWNNQ
jgi:hydroxyacylglutathione hydrolase